MCSCDLRRRRGKKEEKIGKQTYKHFQTAAHFIIPDRRDVLAHFLSLLREKLGAATGGLLSLFFPGRGEELRRRWRNSRASFSTETLDSSHVCGQSFPSLQAADPVGITASSGSYFSILFRLIAGHRSTSIDYMT